MKSSTIVGICLGILFLICIILYVCIIIKYRSSNRDTFERMTKKDIEEISGQKEDNTPTVCCGYCQFGLCQKSHADVCRDSGGYVFNNDEPCKHENACQFQCRYYQNYTYQ